MAALPVAVLGATGRVGRLVVRHVLEAADLTLAAAIAGPTSSHLGTDAGTLAGVAPCGVAVAPVGAGCFGPARVVIDFSLPEGLAAAVDHLGDRALVTGTTGVPQATLDRLDAQARQAPVLVAANFSSGVTTLGAVVATAARALPDYDVEIVEVHHRNKVDAPSGTALYLARCAAEARGVDLDDVAVWGRHGRTGVRPGGEIGIHAVRGGDVVGEHTVWLAGAGDRLELGHVATSRDTFAQGALRAARWTAGRPPGRYTMAQVLGL